MNKPLIVIAAGGTGGHMFPAQALASEMLRRGWRVALASDDRGLRYAGGFPAEVERHQIKAASPLRGGIAAKVLSPFRILRGVFDACMWFKKDRPSCIAGFGGYPALPAMMAGRILGIPSLIHEQNGVLGRVNKMFAGRVNALACGIQPISNAPENANQIYVGNPVRDEVLAVAGMNLPDISKEINLLVFGGSQGASVFSNLVPKALYELPVEIKQRLNITQQVREAELDQVKEVYAKMGFENITLASFFEDMPNRIADSHLIVSRSGASTVAELGVIGRGSVLVPYPAAMDDHQTANAKTLSDRGAAILAPEPEITQVTLGVILEHILSNPDELQKMADAAKKQGKPDAAKELADLVLSIS